ncbi:MAG: hypothetical protein K2X84_11715 [Beijerinckiaceae bacterium]|nr:hypothetical protein [Beijerinckiaceae bacterium]
MKKAALIVALCGLVALLWASAVKTPHHAYRLTVSFETPQGLKRGTSVVHVFVDTRKGLLPNTGGGTAIWGEAIFVDLGDGKNVVALLAPDDIALQAFGRAGRSLMPDEVKSLTGEVALNRVFVPTVVTFPDLNDPAGATILYGVRWRTTPPQGVAPDYIDDFKAVLGVGYGFRSATIEMVPAGIWPLNLVGLTGLPVTRGIEKRIPFLASHREQLYRQSSQLGRYVPMLGHFVQ